MTNSHSVDMHLAKEDIDNEIITILTFGPSVWHYQYGKAGQSKGRGSLILCGHSEFPLFSLKGITVSMLRAEVKRRGMFLPQGMRVSPSQMNKVQLRCWLKSHPVSLEDEEKQYFPVGTRALGLEKNHRHRVGLTVAPAFGLVHL